MFVIIDMILAVAVVAAAAGAVTKFQLRVGHIGASANGAAMVKITTAVIGFGTEGNRAGFRLLCGALFPFRFPQRPLVWGTTGDKGKQIQNIPSRKNQIAGKTNQREQIVGENGRICENFHTNHENIHDSHKPGFHRNEIQHQKLRIGIGGGKHQKHTQMQIPGHVQIDGVGIGHRRKDHGKHIHDQYTGEIKQIKFESSHGHFNSASQHIEEIAENQGQENVIADIFSKYIGKQSPDLALQDQSFVKAKIGIQNRIAGHLCHNGHNGRADDDIQHQIGNALVMVAV